MIRPIFSKPSRPIIMQIEPKFGCGTHVWPGSCTMIGQLGREKIDLIRALKHLSAMLSDKSELLSNKRSFIYESLKLDTYFGILK